MNSLETSSNSTETTIKIHAIKQENNEENKWRELRIIKYDSVLTSLNRIRVYGHQIFFEKILLILTLAFVTVLEIATRLKYFTRKRTPTVRSTSPLSTSSSIRTLEEDINHSSTSLINFNSQINLSSLENSTMADLLVQQQTPNINMPQRTSTQNQTLSHSVDDGLLFYKHLFQRFTSEPQISMYHSTTNGFLNKNFSFLPLNQSEINNFNCDKIEPVQPKDTNSDQIDNISPAIINDELDDEIILNINSSINIECHFRRRKQRSPLIRTSNSNDDIKSITIDSIEKIDNNINLEDKLEEINENLSSISLENLSLNEKKEDNEKLNNKITPSNRFRGRRLRYRSHRAKPSTSEEPPISNNTVEFFVPTETPISTPPSSPVSPISPTNNVSSFNINSNHLTGGLKRTGSIGTTKKMVRFADSVGRELAQVQYICSSIEDDSQKILSTKNNLYVPKSSNFEHKPWSFDIESTSKEFSNNRMPKRFFCLYRQPNSEHPDIYLHEVWRSQIKLEHADIRVKSLSNNEQYLYGTVWVTNASYWKNVTIKYTFNRWLNTYEYEAQHRCHSNDFRNIDQFEFSIDIPHDVDRIEFVLRYHVNEQEHWDNNEGKNYRLEIESASIPQTTISLPHDCDFNEMRFY